MPDSPFTRAEFDMEEVHDLSMDLLHFIEDTEATQNISIAALALSLGRMFSPRTLSPEEQMMFVQGCLDFCAMFHADGRVH